MHRIDTPTAQKDKFGAGKNGFTAGNPQTGTPATDLDNDYFDMLQEELAGVVEATGVNLDKSKHNQLLIALKALLLSREHPFADIKSDGAAALAEALSNLGLGEAAKRDVGTGANQIPDMSSFVFSVSGGVNIYRFPNRMCIQWGNSNTDANGGAIVSLPVAMSAYVPVVIEGLSGNWAGNGGVYDFFTVYGPQVSTASSFLAKSSSYRGSDGKFVAQSTNFNWVVVGTI